MRLATLPIADPGLHVAIIMDGNGRWALAHAHDRSDGHRAGADNVRQIVESAPTLGIRALTLYAFSRDNWSRPEPEVKNLMALLREFLDTQCERCLRDGVRIHVIGSRQRLDYALRRSIASSESATARGTRLDLRIALDYSSRESILAAAQQALASGRGVTGRAIGGAAGRARLRPSRIDSVPDVDLLIRTGGEQRLSDFLLWECAYAELYFTPVLWPDFTPDDLARALAEFQRRERRFGAVSPEIAAARDYWLR